MGARIGAMRDDGRISRLAVDRDLAFILTGVFCSLWGDFQGESSVITSGQGRAGQREGRRLRRNPDEVENPGLT